MENNYWMLQINYKRDNIIVDKVEGINSGIN